MPDYDYMLWIDSDMTWTWEDIERLVSHNEPVVSGVCLIGLQKSNAARFQEIEQAGERKWVLSYLNGWLLDKVPRAENGLVELDMVGFGFVLFQRGVFESQGYPFFRHAPAVAPDGTEMVTSEDMGFTYRVSRAGYPIYVDPEVRIGHQKRLDLKVAVNGGGY